jgi:hypothetical protein
MASFEDLKECLVPPDDPIGTGSPEEWTAVEHRIEFPLPSDYKQFVSTYGRGAIGDEVFVLSPFIDRVAIYHLESEIARERLVYRQTTEQGFLERIFDERHAYLGYEPRPAGLIPWGGDQSGGTAFWETPDSDPDRWTMARPDPWRCPSLPSMPKAASSSEGRSRSS